MRSHRLDALVAVTVTSSSSPPSYSEGGVALGGRGGCRLLDRPAGAVLVVPLLYARFYRRQSVAGSLGCVVS